MPDQKRKKPKSQDLVKLIYFLGEYVNKKLKSKKETSKNKT